MAEKRRDDHRGEGLPFRDEFFRSRGFFPKLFRIGRAEVDEPLARHDSHAGIDSRPGDIAFVKVAVAAGRRPRENHFGKPEKGAPVDHLAVDVLCLGGEHVIMKPLHERQIIGKPPEAGHRQVGVRVHKSRHDDAARCVDRLGRVSRRGIGPAGGKADPASRYADSGVLDDVHAIGQGDQGSAQDEEFDRVHRIHGCSPHIPRLARMRRAMPLTRSMISPSSTVSSLRSFMTTRPLITTVSTSEPDAQYTRCESS